MLGLVNNPLKFMVYAVSCTISPVYLAFQKDDIFVVPTTRIKKG